MALPPDIDAAYGSHPPPPPPPAWLALFRHGRLRAGQSVYVGGGGGNVGSAAVALAAAAGARVVATARPDDSDRVRALGADEVLDHKAPDLTGRARLTEPDGFAVHLDTSGHGELSDAVELLAHGGRLVVMAGLTRTPELPVGRLYTRDASIVGFAI